MNKKTVLFLIAIILVCAVTYFSYKKIQAQNGDEPIIGNQSEFLETEKKVNGEEYCILLCKASVQLGEDISAGPCLSDSNPGWEYEDWVCDIAHSPRAEIDNVPENQCQAYRNGNSHHFVEVDTNCKLIRKE